MWTWSWADVGTLESGSVLGALLALQARFVLLLIVPSSLRCLWLWFGALEKWLVDWLNDTIQILLVVEEEINSMNHNVKDWLNVDQKNSWVFMATHNRPAKILRCSNLQIQC